MCSLIATHEMYKLLNPCCCVLTSLKQPPSLFLNLGFGLMNQAWQKFHSILLQKFFSFHYLKNA
mgnify:CR=1 FL=1